MEKIGMFQAKTHLSEIAERVRQTGQAVTLTKRGEPFVDLVPHQAERPRRSKAEVFAALNRLRKELPKLTKEDIRASISEGRR